MSKSYPSQPVISIDIPEIKDFVSTFFYNFFTPDERTNENGSVPDYILGKTTFASDTKAIDEFSRVIPRCVKFSFSPVLLHNDSFINETNLDDGKKSKITIRSFISKIQNEEKFSNYGFTGLDIQDTGVDGKFYLLLSGTVSKRISDNNLQISNSINEEIENIGSYINSEQVSTLDVAKFLNGESDINIPEKVVINSLNNLKTLGASFIDDAGTKEELEDSFEKIKSVKTRIRLNNKILSKALKTSINDNLGIFSDELGPLLEKSDQLEKNSIENFNASTIDLAEYDIQVEPVVQNTIPNNTAFQPVRKIIGYIIDKFRLEKNGTLTPLEPIILENNKISYSIDYKVSYGTTYVYQIRTIAKVIFQTTDSDTDDIVASTVLISSTPSKKIVVDCIENVPPPPPADFDVSWDGKEKAARLIWSFPPNRQMDIKKFQVFRRASIFDPFQLIKEFDFDNSEIKIQGFENPNLDLVEKLNSPKSYFLDYEFKKESKFIYSLCSIDAHGLTSNYSIQFEVYFDKYKNKIIKNMISNSGAPKSYPNMYLRQDTFVDTIRDSNHSRLKIYFDPEYYSVFAGVKSNKDLDLLSTDKTGGSYKLQIINVDLQKSKLIDIILDDKRTSVNKLQNPNKLNFVSLSKIGTLNNVKSKTNK